MAIPVTCPNCMTRFNVSDQFAGKSGPCPKCQKTIKIPEKSDEVVIHAPEDSGPKDTRGQSVLKPLRRKETSLSVPVILSAVLVTVVVFGVALGLGLSSGPPPTALLAVAAVVLAIPIVLVGYWFLHSDELEGFSGRPLIARGAICAAAFAATWAIYAMVPAYVSGHNSMSEISGLEMAIFVPLMIVLGTLVAIAALELEMVQGFLHYMLYFGITFVLAWLAGVQLSEPLSSSRPDNGIPAVSTPAETPTGAPEAAEEPPEHKIPSVLQ